MKELRHIPNSVDPRFLDENDNHEASKNSTVVPLRRVKVYQGSRAVLSPGALTALLGSQQASVRQSF
jgi:hypothetical protein